jgi:hypothetical protein
MRIGGVIIHVETPAMIASVEENRSTSQLLRNDDKRVYIESK